MDTLRQVIYSIIYYVSIIQPAYVWFLEIAFVRDIGMCGWVCACVCVCPAPRLITFLCDIEPVQPAEQVYYVYKRNEAFYVWAWPL